MQSNDKDIFVSKSCVTVSAIWYNCDCVLSCTPYWVQEQQIPNLAIYLYGLQIGINDYNHMLNSFLQKHNLELAVLLWSTVVIRLQGKAY